MKVVLALFVAVAVAGVAQAKEKKQLSLLGLALPVLEKYVGSKLHLDQLLAQTIGDITGFFSGKKGHMPIPNTQITLDYNIHKCTVHAGKRFIIPKLLEERCKADVCENHLTHSCQSCTKHHQADALKCALSAEVAHVTQLAKAAAAKTG